MDDISNAQVRTLRARTTKISELEKQLRNTPLTFEGLKGLRYECTEEPCTDLETVSLNFLRYLIRLGFYGSQGHLGIYKKFMELTRVKVSMKKPVRKLWDFAFFLVCRL